MKTTHLLSLLLALGTNSGRAADVANPPPVKHAFFAFDNGVGRGQLAPAEQARILKELGYDGISYNETVDLPTDGELYRFDVNHPDTNGMIEYFVRKFGGVRSDLGRLDTNTFRAKSEMRFRSKPAAVVVAPLTEGVLNLPEDCARAASVSGGPFKFTLTSPYMLSRAPASAASTRPGESARPEAGGSLCGTR